MKFINKIVVLYEQPTYLFTLASKCKPDLLVQSSNLVISVFQAIYHIIRSLENHSLIAFSPIWWWARSLRSSYQEPLRLLESNSLFSVQIFNFFVMYIVIILLLQVYLTTRWLNQFVRNRSYYSFSWLVT